jgi:hypothetical protein
MPSAYGFSADDAKRIGRAVRVVERLPPGNQTSGPVSPSGGRGVRLLLAKHEGTNGWAVGASATVTVHNGLPMASALTVVAYNQFLTFSTTDGCTTRWVALGHNGDGWYAIAREPDCTATCSMTLAGINFAALPGYSAGTIQLLGHSAADTTTSATACASIQWYSITTCEPPSPDEQSWLF